MFCEFFFNLMKFFVNSNDYINVTRFLMLSFIVLFKNIVNGNYIVDFNNLV